MALVVAGAWGCDASTAPPLPPPNAPPTLRILQPVAPATPRVGQPVDFEASVEDVEDGASLAEHVLWVSSREGQLARGARPRATFQEDGEQTLTATVVDSGGQVTSTSLRLSVLARAAPLTSILRPAAGSAFNLGELLELECQALTVDGVRLTGDAVQWTSELTGPLPPGAVLKAVLRVAGEDTLTCTATDPETGDGASARVPVTVRATLAPAVLITRPEQEAVYVKAGEPVPFSPTLLLRATARDFNAAGGAGNLDGAIQWTLEPGGVALGAGSAVTHTFTRPGEYTVTARAVDGLGNAATDSVRVRLVTNLPPGCEVEAPLDGARLLLGATSMLRGRCVDPETGATVEPTWSTSAASTPLGTGATVEGRFTVAGAQVLSACAVDPEDAALRGCATRQVRAIVNSAPAGCSIQAPLPEARVNAGRPLALEGSAADAEDPRGDLRFAWTSSRDGALGSGASTSSSRLTTAGSHVLTLTVTDPWGQACTATVAVTVNGAPEVRVENVRQDGLNCLQEPCREGRPVTATGLARDVETPGSLAELAWLDSMGGRLDWSTSSTSVATLSAPGLGRHTVVLRAVDRGGAVGRAAASFTVLPVGRTRLVETVSEGGTPAVALAVAGDSPRYVDGVSAAVFSTQPLAGTLEVSAPARALFSLRGAAGEVLFVGTAGGGVHRCVGGTCARFTGGPLRAAEDRVTSVAALESPDLLLLGTDRGLVLTRASNPSAGGRPGTVVGRRLLEGREVRQVVLSPASTPTQVKAWAATSAGLAEVTVHVDAPFEPALASVMVVPHVPPEVPDVDVLSVAVGPEGQVFAGTRRGFSALGQPGPQLRDAPWGLPDEEVRTLLFERQPAGTSTRDVLWAGTRQGLVRYDVAADIVTLLTQVDGLPAAEVHALLAGPGGARYIGTGGGVALYPGP